MKLLLFTILVGSAVPGLMFALFLLSPSHRQIPDTTTQNNDDPGKGIVREPAALEEQVIHFKLGGAKQVVALSSEGVPASEPPRETANAAVMPPRVSAIG